MHKARSLIIDLFILFIITVPAFLRILNNHYFSMHDDQHIVRLFLLDQGIRQGYIYPRWVDGLGFGFGYPLFNFYPPLIYYLAEVFHLLGFSLIWSIKLLIILGFYLGATGVYLLVKKLTNKSTAFLSATLYTFFFYHSVLVYVRGALAELFSLSLIPFVFLSLNNLFDKTTWKNSVFFGISFGLLILTQPLIALPSLIFIGFMFIFYLLRSKQKFRFASIFTAGFILALSVTSFFWLPSLMERKLTLTDQILTGELANYKLHYIYPQQFLYSPWGYGGSGEGLSDGMTFQLGKIHIGLIVGAIILSIIILISKHLSFRRSKATEKSSKAFLRPDIIGTRFLTSARNDIGVFYFFIFLLIFSLYMTTEYSSFIWDRIKYLWYLQFPWRFLTFTNFFISITGGFFIFFIFRLLGQYIQLQRLEGLVRQAIYFLFTISFIVGVIFTYQKYFRPERFITTTDRERTTSEEISWRISRTSYEFVPIGVKTAKTELGTTILDIDKDELPTESFQLLKGEGEVKEVKNNFAEKIYQVSAITPLIFRLNTYYFPGWKAYLNNKQIEISDINDLKLITVNIPKGEYKLNFRFKNTPVRNLAIMISVSGIFVVVMLNLFQHLDSGQARMTKRDPEIKSG